ncbi:hypothetical protein PV08_02265 [Exophiala spinifera]|uniref:VOC domain-containing protein n=1 Tax=Exophiala spinifera TaxID=91928 RepID=A0A0D2BTE0_9EURO|nr:uncharacterized protein PV08_02265 [Exophiala spinifera]KIW21685.1 hypothetical protein PV08_02265 [Exophiala spinifera]
MIVNLDDISGPQLRSLKLAHVVLRTPDKAVMSQFYVDSLGATIVHENAIPSFITYDNEHHRIALAQIPSLKPKDRGICGLELLFPKHIAFAFDTLEALFLSYRQRKAKGILPFWSVNHGMTISLYYHDPDGNVLETQCDTLDNERANEFMSSKSFQENRIGVDFNLEEILERLKKGESFRDLTHRPDIGPRSVETVQMP